MKSGIAGVFILLGLIGIVGSYFVGGSIREELEWSEQKQDEFATLTNNIHVPKRAEVRQDELDRLIEMQEELFAVKDGMDSKRQIFWIAGLGLTALGLCFQGWDWLDKAKE